MLDVDVDINMDIGVGMDSDADMDFKILTLRPKTGGLPETLGLARILTFMWSFGPLNRSGPRFMSKNPWALPIVRG